MYLAEPRSACSPSDFAFDGDTSKLACVRRGMIGAITPRSRRGFTPAAAGHSQPDRSVLRIELGTHARELKPLTLREVPTCPPGSP